MTTNILFVMHSEKDAQLAAKVIASLPPATAAIAMPVAPSSKRAPPQFGTGAVCVLLWTSEAEEAEVSNVMQGVARHAQNVILFAPGGAVAPEAMRDIERVEHIEHLFGVIQARVKDTEIFLSGRGGRRRSATPELAAARRAGVVPPQKRRFALRGAYGIAATFAAVGVAAPMINARAGVDHTPEPSSGRQSPDAAVSDTDVLVEEIALVVEPDQARPAAYDAWVMEQTVEHAVAEAPGVLEQATVASDDAFIQSVAALVMESARSARDIVLKGDGAVAVESDSQAAKHGAVLGSENLAR